MNASLDTTNLNSDSPEVANDSLRSLADIEIVLIGGGDVVTSGY